MDPDHHPRLNPVRAHSSFHDNVDPSQLEPTSLSDLHDYEPSLEFDDSELAQTCGAGLAPLPPELLDYSEDFLPRSSSDGTIEENFEKELAEVPESYLEITEIAEDCFDDFEIIGLVEVAGEDKLGRRVISIYACRLPPASVLHHDTILRYLIYTLDKYVEQDYIVVYYHCGLNADNRPPLYWLWRAYKAFDRKFKKNLKGLFIVHPTSLIRVALRVVKPFVSVKFFKGQKLTIINYLYELHEHLNWNTLCIPEPVLRYDREVLSKNPVAARKSEEMQKLFLSCFGGRRDRAERVVEPEKKFHQFGATLKQLCLVRGADDDDDVEVVNEDQIEVNIPPIVLYCVQYLSKPEIIVTEGLFRRSITASKLTQMISDVNSEKAVDFGNDPHMAAVLLKSFFRQLPEPILTKEALKRIQRLPVSETEVKIEEVRTTILERLPRPNYAILKYIVTFLAMVADYSDSNKMTITNLAVVFGPNLAWEKHPDIKSIEKVNDFTEFILIHRVACFRKNTNKVEEPVEEPYEIVGSM